MVLRARFAVVTGFAPGKDQMNEVLRAVSRDTDLQALAQGRGRNNFDVWSVFPSNISDVQPLNAFHKIRGVEASLFFCGEPYYHVEYIDSLYFKFPDNAELEKARCLYKELHADWLGAHTSGYGYGIAFASRFIKGLSQCGRREAIPVAIKVTSLAGGRLGVAAAEFALECARLISSPHQCEDRNPSLVIGAEGQEVMNPPAVLRLELSNICVMGEKRPDEGELEVRVPFKRPVALPRDVCTREAAASLLIPASPALQQGGARLHVLALGGAEHNLGLVHLLNVLRWSLVEPPVVFEENVFDADRRTQPGGPMFSAGTETLVRAYNAKLRNRGDDANAVELLLLRVSKYPGWPAPPPATGFGGWGEVWLALVYGFSAPMTRIGVAKLLTDQQYLTLEGCRVLKYGTTNDRRQFFNSEELLEWNQMDCWNNWNRRKVRALLRKHMSLGRAP